MSLKMQTYADGFELAMTELFTNREEIKEEMKRLGYPYIDACFQHRGFRLQLDRACRGEFRGSRRVAQPHDRTSNGLRTG